LGAIVKFSGSYSFRAAMMFAAGIFAAMTSARANVITFDDVVVTPTPNVVQTAVTSGGFNFTSGRFFIINSPSFCSTGGCASDGTQYAAEVFNPDLGGAVTMTKAGGGVFTLNGFDGAEAFIGVLDATSIHVVGNLLAGGTLTANFALDGFRDGAGGVSDFQSFFFSPAWSGLTSVVWSGLNSAGRDGSGLAFDNIVVDVPEPASLTLAGAGIAAAAALRRRKKKRV
jgi:PEP-CTERM motif-containing protein